MYGVGKSDGQLRSSVERIAAAKLKRIVPPVRCPGCQRLQSNMLPQLRREYLLQYQALGAALPALLGLMALGIALMQTDFLEQPLQGGSLVWVIVLSGVAGMAALLFGLRPWLTARKFTVEHFSDASIPLGQLGPAPMAQVAPSQPVGAADHPLPQRRPRRRV